MEFNDIYLIIGILLIHWFADFVLQTDKQAKGKSSDWSCLLAHTGIYSLMWFLPCLGYLSVTNCSHSIMLFPLVTFIAHTITDFYTSRINSQLYKDGKIHEFFVSVGFDQVLHYVQLLLTYKLLV